MRWNTLLNNAEEQERLGCSGTVQLRSPVLQKGAGYKEPLQVWFNV